MHKKVSTIFAQVVFSCCVLVVHSVAWASPQDELSSTLLEVLGKSAVAYKEMGQEWDGENKWVQVSDGGVQASEDFRKEMNKCSSNMAAMIFEGSDDFSRRFIPEQQHFMEMLGKQSISDIESYALLAYLSYLSPELTLTDIGSYSNQANLHSHLRFIPVTYWDDVYRVLYHNSDGYHFLQNLNGGNTPSDPDKMKEKSGLEVRSIGEAYTSARIMKISQFKSVPVETLASRQKITFPASVDKVVDHLLKVIMAVSSSDHAADTNPLNDFMALSAPFDYQVDPQTKIKLTDAVTAYCSVDKETVKEADALLALGACELDRTLKSLYRLAMLDIYMSAPGVLDNGQSTFDAFRTFNDILSMYTGAEQKQPVFTMHKNTPEERANVARENLHKGKALRAKLAGISEESGAEALSAQ